MAAIFADDKMAVCKYVMFCLKIYHVLLSSFR